MANRKPLEDDCDGGIWCPAEGHVVGSWQGARWTVRHVPLTAGQRKTLRERLLASFRAAGNPVTVLPESVDLGPSA